MATTPKPTPGAIKAKPVDLSDEAAFVFVPQGEELALVIDHLGLRAVAENENWTGALVGQGQVHVTTSSRPDMRTRLIYEDCVFRNGSVPAKFRAKELYLRAQHKSPLDLKFGYYINLDERGSFRADVRDIDGKSLFLVLGGNELAPDESSLVDHGFMRNLRDLKGLREHLCSMGVLPAGASLYMEAELDRQVERDSGHWMLEAPSFATEAPDLDEIEGARRARANPYQARAMAMR